MTLPTFPIDNPQRLLRIRRVLDDAGYNEATLSDVFGKSKSGIFSHAVSLAKWEFLTRDDTRLNILIRLFALGLSEPSERVAKAVQPTSLDDWLGAGLLRANDDQITAQVHLFRYSDYLFAGDVPHHHQHPQAVLALSNAAATLAQYTIRQPAGKACDLGTGCGVLAVLAAGHSQQVVATDVNPRAVQLAQINAQLNGVDNLDAREGSWFDPIAGEKFDLFFSNPPFVISPESQLLFRDGGERGDGVFEKVLRQAPLYLNEGGFVQLLGNWTSCADQDGEERLSAWVNDLQCDAWVLCFEKSDLASYAELWIRNSAKDDPALFERWMNYYAEQEITEVTVGIVFLRKRSGANWFYYEEGPKTIGWCGMDVLRGFAQRDAVQLADDALLQTTLSLDADMRLEQQLRPSGKGWTLEQIRLQRTSGLASQAAIDPNMLGLASAFVEKRSVRDALESLSREWNADVDIVVQSALPAIRKLMLDGFLRVS